MSCAICDSKQREAIDAAMRSKPMPGWKRMSKEFGVPATSLMAHRAHVAAATIKKAIQRTAEAHRVRIRRGATKSQSVEEQLASISHRLSKLSDAALASGDTSAAVNALSSLRATLADIREIQTDLRGRDVTINVVYRDVEKKLLEDAHNDPRRIAVALKSWTLRLLDSSPPEELAVAAGRLVALLQGKGADLDELVREHKATVN